MKWASPEKIAERRQETRQWLATIFQPAKGKRGKTDSDNSSGESPIVPREYPISKPLLDYLVVCADDWTMPVTARDKKHGISTGVGNRYRKRLAAEGLLRFHCVLTGRRGGQLQVTEVTEEAHKLLERIEAKVKRPPGRGGFEHRLWQYIVHCWAVRQGYPSTIEQEVAGKPVDVGVIWDEKRVAVEIVVKGIEKELFNLKDLERSWDQIVFCAVNQETLDRVREKILDTFGDELIRQDKVRFVRLNRFLEKKPKGKQEG